jgi:hypothetical protein
VQSFEVFGELESRVDLRVFLACALLTSPSTVAGAYLGQLYQRRSLCHVLRLRPWPDPTRSSMVEIAEELLLLGGGWHGRQLVFGDRRGTGQAGRGRRCHCCRGHVRIGRVCSDNSRGRRGKVGRAVVSCQVSSKSS